VNFEYSDEQRALHESLTRWLDKHHTFAQRRERLQAAEPRDDATWHTFAEMGLLALPLPEAHGGLGGNSVDMAGVMGCLGAKLVLEPYLPTVLAALLIAEAGTPAQRERWLPAVAQGRTRLAFAHAEPGVRHARTRVATAAQRVGDGWRLTGHKAVVVGAPQADALVVSARSAGEVDARAGLALFVVDAAARGIELRSYRNHDGQRAADVHLNDVRVPAAQCLAGAEAAAVIEHALDRGAAALCGEALGVMRALNDATLEYLKTRQQFGVAIGSFQALQHRMVDCYVDVELNRSLLFKVLSAWDDGTSHPAMVPAVKARLSKGALKTVRAALQLHGAIGYTDEHDVGVYYKRAVALAAKYGNEITQVDRFSYLTGPTQRAAG